MGFLDNIDLAQLEAYLSGSAKASASGNEAEGRYYNARDAVKAQLYGAQQNAATQANAQGLTNAKFSTALPGIGASEAVRGSQIQNMQDAGVDLGTNRANVVNFSGGTRPSNLTPEARAAGGDLIKHGQSLIADPKSFVPAQQTVAPPAMSPEPKAGFWGQAAGAGATAAGLLSALGGGKGATPGAPGGGGSNIPLGDIVNWLRHFGDASEEDSPTYHEPDMRSGGSGTAYGPDGMPLPVDDPNAGGGDGGYYDDETGQYIFPGQNGGDGSNSDNEDQGNWGGDE